MQINPQHNIPAIVDGELTLNESHAIVAYLANAYAPKTSIYPTDPKIRAKVDQMMYFDTNIFYKTFGEIVVSRDIIIQSNSIIFLITIIVL